MNTPPRPDSPTAPPSGARSSPSPSPGAAARIGFGIAVFGTLLLPGILNAGIVPLELTPIMAEYGLDERLFGLLAGSIAIVAVLLGLSAVWAVPRWGAYRVSLLGYGLFAAGLAGVTWMPAGLWALPFAVLIAWGMAYLHQGNGLVVRLAPQRAATMTNLLHGLNGLGKALGPAFALIGSGWRGPFRALAGLALALGLAGLLGKPPSAREADPASPPEEAPAREALRQPFFWACTLPFFAILGMELVVILWLPRYLRSGAGFDPATGRRLGLEAQATILGTMCVVRFLAPLLLLKIPPPALMSICALGSFGILLGTEGGYWTGAAGRAGLVLCGLAFSTPWPTFFALACRYFPRHRGLLSVVSGAATSLAWIVFSVVGGILGATLGLRWTLRLSPLLGLVVIGAAVGVHLAGERRERRAKRTAPPGGLAP